MELRPCEDCGDPFEPMFKDDYVCDSCREAALELDREEQAYGDHDYTMND